MASKYMTNTGSGTGDGSTWGNAYNGSTRANWDTAFAALGDGDVLYVAGQQTYPSSGNFTSTLLTTTTGGTADYKKVIGVLPNTTTPATGTNRPLIKGNWALATFSSGATAISIPTLQNYVWFQSLRLSNWNNGIINSTSGRTNKIRVYDVDFTEMRNCITIHGDSACTGVSCPAPTNASNDIIFSGLTMSNYTKRGFRLRDGTYNGQITSCTLDGGGITYGVDNFPIGVDIGNGTSGAGVDTPDHDWTLTNVISSNHYYNHGVAAFWNADGFSCEDNTYNIVFVRCKAFNNVDGGFDIKWNNANGNPPTLTDCVAVGNCRNFRFHSSGVGSALLSNCFGGFANKLGGSNNLNSAACIWGTGSFSATSCTFHSPSSGGTCIRLEDSGAVGAAVFTSCIVSMIATDTSANIITRESNTINGSTNISALTNNGTVVYNPGVIDSNWVAGTNPAYTDPTNSAFLGTDTSFNPATYLDLVNYVYTKGYSYGTPVPPDPPVVNPPNLTSTPPSVIVGRRGVYRKMKGH